MLVRYHQEHGDKVLLTSTKTQTNMSSIIPTLLSMNKNPFTTVGSYFAVMGIPNVGKSSIIRFIQKSSSEFRKSKFDALSSE